MAIMHKAIKFLLPEFETIKSQWSKLQVDNCLSLFLRQLCCLSYASVQRDFHITWCSCRRRVTRQVLLVDQEMDILPDHLCSTKVFLLCSCFSIFIFLCFVLFCHCLFLSFYLWPLCCLSFIDWRLLILLPLWYLQHFLISYI